MTDKETEKAGIHDQLEQLARRKFQERLEAHDLETRRQMIQAMRDNNADPAYIHAFEKTGLLVFQETLDQFTPEQLEEWADAYEEYPESAS